MSAIATSTIFAILGLLALGAVLFGCFITLVVVLNRDENRIAREANQPSEHTTS